MVQPRVSSVALERLARHRNYLAKIQDGRLGSLFRIVLTHAMHRGKPERSTKGDANGVLRREHRGASCTIDDLGQRLWLSVLRLAGLDMFRCVLQLPCLTGALVAAQVNLKPFHNQL